jgi:hypothetical protein
MKRISIFTQTCNLEKNFLGWFDTNAAEELASYKEGDPYTFGKILLATAGGKLVVNEWSNSGMDIYRFADDEDEIAEILVRGGYDGDSKRLLEILDKYRV